MLVHEVPLLANVKVKMPYGPVVALTGSVKVPRFKELIALLSQLVCFFKSLVLVISE